MSSSNHTIGAALTNDPAQPHALTVQQQVYLWLSGVFITCFLVANVIGVKLFAFEAHLFGYAIPVEHTVGMLPFPITFLLTDLLNEYYGKRAARRMTYIAFVMGALAFILMYIGRAFPIKTGIPGTATQEAFENIFGSATLMYLASLGAFLIGSLLDIFLFTTFKRLTGGKLIWLRATGSTVISQLVDSFAITFLFFTVMPVLFPSEGSAPAPIEFVIKTAFTGYILKFVIAVALTPGIYAGRWALSTWFGLTPIPASRA
jgi:uncharacterized integral membrane protein (TIGR00697 family)